MSGAALLFFQSKKFSGLNQLSLVLSALSVWLYLGCQGATLKKRVKMGKAVYPS
jgi:hypothetical protein